MKGILLNIGISLSLLSPLFSDSGHHHEAVAEGSKIVKGETIDMVCYLDHNAQGEKHASCAKTCIESGLPVGIKAGDGKVYLIVGEHKPINKSLVQYAAKTIAVKGKFITRDGFNMLENAQIVGEVSSGEGAQNVIYTCPMHPEVNETSTGKCPKCGMNLEPIKK